MKRGAKKDDEEAVIALLRGGWRPRRREVQATSYFTLRTPIEVDLYGDSSKS